MSKEFPEKIKETFEKMNEKIEKFKTICNNWKEAYEKFDLDAINNISKEANKKIKSVSLDNECVAENNLIQNMTKMINVTKQKLTSMQYDICKMV